MTCVKSSTRSFPSTTNSPITSWPKPRNTSKERKRITSPTLFSASTSVYRNPAEQLRTHKTWVDCYTTSKPNSPSGKRLRHQPTSTCHSHNTKTCSHDLRTMNTTASVVPPIHATRVERSDTTVTRASSS